jgi:hypothetical protein
LGRRGLLKAAVDLDDPVIGVDEIAPLAEQPVQREVPAVDHVAGAQGRGQVALAVPQGGVPVGAGADVRVAELGQRLALLGAGHG